MCAFCILNSVYVYVFCIWKIVYVYIYMGFAFGTLSVIVYCFDVSSFELFRISQWPFYLTSQGSEFESRICECQSTCKNWYSQILTCLQWNYLGKWEEISFFNRTIFVTIKGLRDQVMIVFISTGMWLCYWKLVFCILHLQKFAIFHLSLYVLLIWKVLYCKLWESKHDKFYYPSGKNFYSYQHL